MPDAVLTKAIDALASGRHLSVDEAAEVLAVIMAGDASEVQIAGVLIALRTKGETVEELAGLARTMRALAARVTTSRQDLVDTAGTGGGRPTFNVSTTAALIAAGAGCAVAKHGNRSATSRSGSADVLEALGVQIDLGPEAVGTCIDELGFGFMFAPRHHQATRFVVPVRKELAVRTIFNFLGPLTNPAGARRQVIGVSDPAYIEIIAGALAAARRRSRARRVLGGRARRDQHLGPDHSRRSRRHQPQSLHHDPRGLRAGDGCGCAGGARRLAGGQRRHDARDLRRRGRPAPRHRRSQRRSRDLRRGPRRRRRQRRRGRTGRDRRRRRDPHARRADRPHATARGGGGSA